MSEIHRKVIPYEHNYLCDQCNRGMLICQGDAVDGMYPHTCAICGHQSSLSKAYPHVEFYGEGEEPSNQ